MTNESKSVRIRIIVILTAVFLLIVWTTVYVLSYTPIEIPIDRIYEGYRLTYFGTYYADRENLPLSAEPTTLQFSGTLYRYLIPYNFKDDWQNHNYFVGSITVDGKMLDIIDNNERIPSTAVRFSWGKRENTAGFFTGDRSHCQWADHTGAQFHHINARFCDDDPYIRISMMDKGDTDTVLILPASTPEEAAQMYWDEEMHSWFET